VDEDFGYQACGEKDYRGDGGGSAPEGKGPCQEEGQQERQEGGQAEGVGGAFRVAGEEEDGEEIEEAFEKAGETVVGTAMAARMVRDDQLGDAETHGVGQKGSEAVELSLETEVLGYLGAVGFESAVDAMQLESTGDADGGVEEAGGDYLAQGVMAYLLPAGYQVIALVEEIQEAGDFCGVVLEIAVHGENDVATGGGEAGLEGDGLAEVTAEAEGADLTGAMEAGNFGPGLVGGAVVYEQDFVVRGENLLQGLAEGGDGVLFVVNGDDDADGGCWVLGVGCWAHGPHGSA